VSPGLVSSCSGPQFGEQPLKPILGCSLPTSNIHATAKPSVESKDR
jgi:hypothetical protein